GGSRLPVEPAAGSPRNDDGPEALEDERGIAMREPDGAAHPRQLEVQGFLPDARGRGDIGPENADADPAQAAERAEPVTVALRELDRSGPVRLDAEICRTEAPAAITGDEDDR